jgi:predicted phage-related endonuclease
MRIIEAEQRSPEWRAARVAKLTGSRACDAVGFLKSGKETAARRDYRLELVVEHLTAQPYDSNGFVSAEMQRGIDLEPAARAQYEARTGSLVRTTGFVIGDDPRLGCSLDGDIDDFTGIIEIKCPKSATHIRYLRDKLVPEDYRDQVRHNLLVTGAKWCDFISYDDRLPAGLDWFCVRVYPAHLDVAGYAKQADVFLAEVAVDLADIRKLQTEGTTP